MTRTLVTKNGVALQRVEGCELRAEDFPDCILYLLNEEGDPVDAEGNVVSLAPLSVDPWIAIRITRNAVLAASDWTQLADIPDSTRSKWASYRQALRDLPESQTDPADISWPTPPA